MLGVLAASRLGVTLLGPADPIQGSRERDTNNVIIKGGYDVSSAQFWE